MRVPAPPLCRCDTIGSVRRPVVISLVFAGLLGAQTPLAQSTGDEDFHVYRDAPRLLLTPQYVQGIDFSKQVTLLEQATDTIVAMVRSIRSGAKLEQIKMLHDKLQYYEGEADKQVIELLRELFNGQHEPIKVIVLKDLYELLEKVIDRCRDVGNIITNIALKNS